MACKEGQFDVVELMANDQFNLNAQHVNGMTSFDCTVISYSSVVCHYDFLCTSVLNHKLANNQKTKIL